MSPELDQKIQAALELKDNKKASALSWLAIDCRDQDDMEGYQAVTQHFTPVKGFLPKPNDITFHKPIGWKEMYEGKNNILVFKEKHDNEYFLINSPDSFAAACIGKVKARLDDGWYGEPGIYIDREPNVFVDPYLLKTLDRIQSSKDKLLISQTINAWKDDNDFKLLKEKVEGRRIAYYLEEELNKPLADDKRVGFLALLIHMGGGHDEWLWSKLKEFKAPISSLVQQSLDFPKIEFARKIINIFNQGEKRKAGRYAYELLYENRGFQYEGMLIEQAVIAQYPEINAPSLEVSEIGLAGKN